MRRKLEILKKDKKGQFMGLVIFLLILFSIIVFGFIASMVIGILGYGSDILTPVIQDIGVVGDANITQAANDSVVIVDDFIQALPWIVGFGYVVALIMSVIFTFTYKSNPNPIFIGFYVMLMILLVIGAIVISNIYENIYTGDDEIALKLQEQTILSFMILYSPTFFVLIGFLTGVYLFVGRSEEGVTI